MAIVEKKMVLEFNRDLCPTAGGALSMFGQAIAECLRTGNPEYLPPGVTVVAPDRVIPGTNIPDADTPVF